MKDKLAKKDLATFITETESSFESAVEPVRQSVFKRFPTLFLLLVTFGVTAVVFGFEQSLLLVPLFRDNPLFIFLLGVGILIFTGRLYKKLG